MGLWSISQWENPQHATGQGSVPSNKQTLYNYVTLSPIVLSAKPQNTELSDWATSHIHPTGSSSDRTVNKGIQNGAGPKPNSSKYSN